MASKETSDYLVPRKNDDLLHLEVVTNKRVVRLVEKLCSYSDIEQTNQIN